MQLLVPITNPAALRKSQQAFDFDEESHPRASAGSPKGGQFVRKEDVPEKPPVRTGKDITDEDFQSMLRAAQDWRYLQMRTSDALEDRKDKFAHAKTTTKGDLDQWLMDRFNIEPDMARKISNTTGLEMELPYWQTEQGTRWKPFTKRPEPSFDEYPDLRWQGGHAQPLGHHTPTHQPIGPPFPLAHPVKKSVAVLVPLTKALPKKQEDGHDTPPQGYPKKRKQYGDPANYKYPIDTEEHVRAAWSYINMPRNAARYTPEQVNAIKARIQRAGKPHGVDFSAE